MNNKELLKNAIGSVRDSQFAFIKFLSANDTGKTRTHQSGILLPANVWNMFLEKKGENGQNFDRLIPIQWNNSIMTDSRVVWYGARKHEYRLTRIIRLYPEMTGSLLVITKKNNSYSGYILSRDEDIEKLMDEFGLTPAQTNRIIQEINLDLEEEERAQLKKDMLVIAEKYPPTVPFPATIDMSAMARGLADKLYGRRINPRSNPDRMLTIWIDIEFELFKTIEEYRMQEQLKKGFANVEAFLGVALSITNRRKSRAGKSFEHMLAALFGANGVKFSEQSYTEGRKKPDFIFPSIEAYHDESFPEEGLLVLGAKTTCKDRWRQILNEADRMKSRTKFLITMQQGNTAQQLEEMEEENVVLIVPKPYIRSYPVEFQNRIWSISQFIDHVKKIEQDYPYH